MGRRECDHHTSEVTRSHRADKTDNGIDPLSLTKNQTAGMKANAAEHRLCGHATTWREQVAN
jgi:hypothetical protein